MFFTQITAIEMRLNLEVPNEYIGIHANGTFSAFWLVTTVGHLLLINAEERVHLIYQKILCSSNQSWWKKETSERSHHVIYYQSEHRKELIWLLISYHAGIMCFQWTQNFIHQWWALKKEFVIIWVDLHYYSSPMTTEKTLSSSYFSRNFRFHWEN